MKKIVFGILTFIVFLFAGCYEVNEEITINDNGSGTYITKMDMSAMIQMIQSMAGDEELAKNGLDRVVDTVISMKSIMDSATDVTAEQKRLFSAGTMKLQMNMKESLFKAETNFPFKNYNDLQTLMSGAATSGLGQVFKNMFSKDSTNATAGMQDQGMDQITNVYDMVVTKNRIARKLNKQKYDSLMQRPEIAQAKQMMGSFEILYTTTIKLPRPVKKVDNDLVTLSADKKTVTMKYDVIKILDTPEKFSYSIDY
jgi:hypothetical protein